MFYIIIKNYMNPKLSLALNLPSVIYMMKNHCIYFINVFIEKIYGTNLDYILQKKLIYRCYLLGLPAFKISCLIILLLILKYNIYNICNSRANNNLNFESLKCVMSGIKCIEEAIKDDDINKKRKISNKWKLINKLF